MAERSLDAIVLFGPHNIAYLTGMDSENLFDPQACILVAGKDPVLVILDFDEKAERCSWAERLRAEGAPVVAIDPDLDNLRARRAYEKAGFHGSAVVESGAGPAVLMLLEG